MNQTLSERLVLRGEFSKRQERERIRRRYRYLVAAQEGATESMRMFRTLVTSGWTWAAVLAVFALWSNLR